MAQQQSQQQQSQQQPIFLFISKDCPNCMSLITELRKKPEIAKNIQGIPIETAPRLPPGLSRVPTLVVKGKMLVGKECFEWVEKQGELEAGPILGAKGFENSNFSFIEGNDEPSQGGLSDSFSFIGAKNGSQGVENQQQQPQQQQPQQQQPQQNRKPPPPFKVNKRDKPMSIDQLQAQRNLDTQQLNSNQSRQSISI
jgi:hypothetical protein